MDAHWIYRPLLDLIGEAEGTDRGDGYNETLAYGAYTGGDVNLVGMNLGDIDRLQTRMLVHPDNRWNSSAIGRYQIVRTTLRMIKRAMGWSDSKLYNANTQDAAARYLLYIRGIDSYAEGKKGEDAMLLSLAQEWASFPKPNGQGYYSGQGGKLKPSRVRTALREVKRRYNEAPVVVKPKPDPVVVKPKPEPKERTGMSNIVWNSIGAVIFVIVVAAVLEKMGVINLVEWF